MAHGHHDNEQSLSISWPFTFAGLCLTFALSWFCLGFAIADRKLPEPAETVGPTKLPAHYELFWIALALGAVSVIVGIAFNMTRDSRRHAS
jgi:hypothetical protein